MFICEDCGAIFEEPDVWEEYRGECHGSPAYEKMCGCPYCRGGFSEYCGDDECEDEIPEMTDEEYEEFISKEILKLKKILKR